MRRYFLLRPIFTAPLSRAYFLLGLFLFACAVSITMAYAEITISANSKLDKLEYDVENVHLTLENLNSRWYLSGSGKLVVESLHAKRLHIVMHESAKKTNASGLPERITLPFPLTIQQAEIAEIVLETASGKQVVTNVQLELEADNKTIKINRLSADTPVGSAEIALNMASIYPYPLTGKVMLKHANHEIASQLSGDLKVLGFDMQSVIHKQDNRFLIATSNSASQPVGRISLHGDINIDTKVINNIAFQANINTNNIQASGSLGAPDSQLDWQAEMPNLSDFGEQFAGQLQVKSTLKGSLENLAVQLSLAAEKLHLPGQIKIEKLTGQASLLAGEQGQFDATFKATSFQLAKNAPLQVSLGLQGTRAQHTLNINATGKALYLESQLKGGLLADQWQGFLQTLSYKNNANIKAEKQITLQTPAKLTANLGELTLENAILQFVKGRAEITMLQVGKDGLTTQGTLQNVGLADIPPSIFTLPPKLQGNPVFSGAWNIISSDTLNGRINLQRESGDFEVINANGNIKPLGLGEVKVAIDIVQNNAVLNLLIAGQQLGNIDLQANTSFTKTPAGFALLSNAPLTMKGNAQLKTLAFLPIAGLDNSFDGELTMNLSANGTVVAPNLLGNLTAKNLQLSMPSQSVLLTDGTLTANFENDQLLITQGTWRGGAGSINTSGVMRLEKNKPYISLDWLAKNFTAIAGTDRLLTLDGAGKTTLTDGLLTISGDFKVVKGNVELPSEDAPSLSDDVVILGKNDETATPSMQVLLNSLRIDLGDDFTLRGRGLNAQLVGDITLVGLTQYHPHSTGAIRVKKGTFMAYGQVLNIERGNLNFNGPVDNPSLNIRAMRNSESNSIATDTSTVNTTETIVTDAQAVNAGVEITGSAIAPVIKLVSVPNVTDTEKLSWLMLGHGTDKAGKADFSLLSLAAGALFSQGESVPLQTQIARAAGLDELSFAGADAETASLTFGKRLTSQLYLSYVKSISGLLDVARLTLNLTPRWSIQAETGTESAVDALYTFGFN